MSSVTLKFGTGGTPNSTEPRTIIGGIERIGKLGLDSMELEFVRGSFPGEATCRKIAEAGIEHNVSLTAHGPYYINLNAVEPDKREASRSRVINTAYYGSLCGAESITFHAGFYLEKDPETVAETIHEELGALCNQIGKLPSPPQVCPETTGKPTQFGSIDELLALAADIDGCGLCIDWSHLHARTGCYNTESEFQAILDQVKESLGQKALEKLHMHISGIEFSPKGERKHLNLEESDMRFRELLAVLKDNNVGGWLICESPSLEDDALMMKTHYDSLP